MQNDEIGKLMTLECKNTCEHLDIGVW